MSKIAEVTRPASELERLIAELSESGPLVFVFGIGWWTAHLVGSTAPIFRGPTDRRWWHVQLGDDAASWTMSVRVDEITGVQFVRSPNPFPSFPGQESLTVQFLGPLGETVLYCYLGDLYDGQQMRPERCGPGRCYASATATATNHGSTEGASSPLLPEPPRSPARRNRRAAARAPNVLLTVVRCRPSRTSSQVSADVWYEGLELI